MEDYRAQFIDIYNKNVTRPGADRLLKWLEGTDFFTAPASTKFHGACECGLVMHSINVYNAMMQHFFTEGEDSPETFAVCALLHDVCKANFYKVSTRNVKNDATGQWEKVPFYQVADQLPYGHGEKSVYLIEHFMRLKTDEAIAIRWHMGGFDDAVRGGSFAVSDAYNRYPLAVKLPVNPLIAVISYIKPAILSVCVYVSPLAVRCYTGVICLFIDISHIVAHASRSVENHDDVKRLSACRRLYIGR